MAKKKNSRHKAARVATQFSRIMKQTIFRTIVWTIGCLLCSLVAYRAGIQRGKEEPNKIIRELPLRVFFNGMAALEELRANRVENGTRTVEKICFASAALVYSDPAFRNMDLVRFCTSDVIQYRATYCTNSAEWTKEEKQLAELLTGLK